MGFEIFVFWQILPGADLWAGRSRTDQDGAERSRIPKGLPISQPPLALISAFGKPFLMGLQDISIPTPAPSGSKSARQEGTVKKMSAERSERSVDAE